MLDKIAAAVQDLAMEVEQVHNEGAPGQFEVVTAHQPAMQARARPPEDLGGHHPDPKA